MSGHPHICTPHTFVCPLYICMPPGCTHPHRPHALLCTCMVLEHLHVVGEVVICFSVCWDTSLTPPLFGGASLLITPPTLSCWFPVQCYSQGYWYLMWAFPLLLKGFGVFPITWGGFGGISALQLSTCSFLYIFYSALCLMFRPQLQLLLLQLQWYLLACHQCHQ